MKKLFDTFTVFPFCLIGQRTKENKRKRDNPKRVHINNNNHADPNFYPLGQKKGTEQNSNTLQLLHYFLKKKNYNFSSGYSQNSINQNHQTTKTWQKHTCTTDKQ